jgi:predicted RNA-binding Zn-ribbon protein involved in translation (DUF1610 family)
MQKDKESKTQDTESGKETSTYSCPKCGRELKSMRCRIDGMELYCPVCRLTFDPAAKKNQRAG